MATPTVTVCVATFGDESWRELAIRRAIPSAAAELPDAILHVHGESLHDARNRCLERVRTEWVIYLDADDELEPGYVGALLNGPETGDLRAPAVRYVPDGVDPDNRRAYVPRVAGHRHDCETECLEAGNYLVIGTAVRADLVRAVGGWHDWPVYEDWDLWLRCKRAGATVASVPDAVYRAGWRAGSRNRAPSREVKDQTHHAIVEANRER
mgnify:CR=1 FL=1